MASIWFVRGGGKVYGPLDSAKLKQLAAAGKIVANTDVAQSQDGPWFAAGKLKGLIQNASVAGAVPVGSQSPPAPAYRPPIATTSPASETGGPITLTFHEKLLNSLIDYIDEQGKRAGGARLLFTIASNIATSGRMLFGVRLSDGSKQPLTRKMHAHCMLLMLFVACFFVFLGYPAPDTKHRVDREYFEELQYVREGNHINLNQVETKVRMVENIVTRETTAEEKAMHYVGVGVIVGPLTIMAFYQLFKLLTFGRGTVFADHVTNKRVT